MVYNTEPANMSNTGRRTPRKFSVCTRLYLWNTIAGVWTCRFQNTLDTYPNFVITVPADVLVPTNSAWPWAGTVMEKYYFFIVPLAINYHFIYLFLYLLFYIILFIHLYQFIFGVWSWNQMTSLKMVTRWWLLTFRVLNNFLILARKLNK